MEIKPVTEFGALKEGLRDVRFGSDGVFDLYTSEVVDPSKIRREVDVSDKIESLLADAKPIIEGPKILRLIFSPLIGIRLEEDCGMEVFGDPLGPQIFKSYPISEDKSTRFPILEIEGSPLLKNKENFLYSENVRFKHYRILSEEGEIDVIGQLKSHKWIDNELYADQFTDQNKPKNFFLRFWAL